MVRTIAFIDKTNQKEQANDLPPLEEALQPAECKKIPVLGVGELWPFVFRSKDKVWSGLP